MNTWELDACEVADRVRAGELSAVEVLETCLERIGDLDKDLNGFVHLDPDGARLQAKEIDRRVSAGEDPGAFAGVPMGVKDLEDAEGMPTTHGSVPYRDHIAQQDSVQVARLRAAGAVIVGKTAAPEFGTVAFTSTPLHGTTRNPWNLERTPGGSSGGSAAAVAAALVPIATGSDGGGSIRIPASYSGLFGPKGTFGRVPRGDLPDSSLTSCYGPMARGVRDAARWFDVTAGTHERDQFSLPKPEVSWEANLDAPPAGLRVAWTDTLGYAKTGREVAEIARRAADDLVAVVRARWSDRPAEIRDASASWGLLNSPSLLLEAGEHWPAREEDFTVVTRLGISIGENAGLSGFAKAFQRRWENNVILSELFEEIDVIITPTTPTTAFAAEGPIPHEIDGERVHPIRVAAAFTAPFNLSGHPAVSLPAGFDAQGLPVGLQVVTRRQDDLLLLRLAAVFERTRPWPKIAAGYAS